ncbi:M24 family metallopeptidase [Rhodothermus marinus]|uniref:Peptidase M24 n=1 Tax=Rhodothermus marinus (strain ATCC 43812 / DSM 4252 / R-10) TaxID=518766 RepID=D0MIA3_RHOM4|nr:Xaa-Pro peptidase family protein [Rhodothermus marinus]ACY48211.1 peptidase M24 [Rhodothermus marinus DSM 4252]
MTAARIARIQERLSQTDADAALISALPDIRWACGFSGSNALLLVRRDGAHFLTDGRYTTQAEQEVQGIPRHAAGSDLMGYAVAQGLLEGVRRLLYQADHLTCARLQAYQELLPDVEWVGVENWLCELTAVKDETALQAIRQAQAITEQVFEEILPLIRPGVTERELAAEIVYRHLRLGAERMAFEPIVASGPNSALPHARPTHRAFDVGDVVLLDFGCHVDGYASDMTRTVVIGPPSREVEQVYETVRAAQEAALAIARAGITAAELDQAARAVIEAAGWGEYFTHSLGHGVGLQVHEWPRIASGNEEVLPVGAVVTIEPGIYLPGRFGIRIEDLIVLKPDGHENLTRLPRTLLIL